MSLTILHNPRCSKSRKTLEIIREHGEEPEIIEYLKSPPDATELLKICKKLGVPVATVLRRGEAEYRDAVDRPDEEDDRALANWLAVNIRVLERPIVVADDGRAVIGRPPESVLALLGS